jgi:hypothetical protein
MENIFRIEILNILMIIISKFISSLFKFTSSEKQLKILFWSVVVLITIYVSQNFVENNWKKG